MVRRTTYLSATAEPGPAPLRPDVATICSAQAAAASLGPEDELPAIGGVFGGTRRLLRADLQAELAEARRFAAEGEPLCLEIGFGDGSFLAEFAAAQPEARCLGLEVRRKLVLLARAKAAARGVTNVRVLEGDARVVLPRLVAPGRLQQVFILFPDPWCKDRHWARRTLVTPPFALLLHGLLASGGVVTCKTDVPAVAAQIQQVFDEAPGYVRTAQDRVVAPPSATTRRERRCLSEGAPFVVLRWAQQELPSPGAGA